MRQGAEQAPGELRQAEVLCAAWREGPYTKWYDNGTKEREGTYKDGKKHGPFTTWDKDGKLLEQTTWKDGVKVNVPKR